MTDLIRKTDALAACEPKDYDHEHHRQAKVSIHNAIAALPAVKHGIKPLVWEDFGDWGAKASAYYQANYLIQFWKGREQFEVALSYPGYQTGFDGERWHPTLDAAKAAAQADYEARILAALEPAAADIITALLTANAALRAERDELSSKLEVERALTDAVHRLAKAAEAQIAALKGEQP